MCQERGNVTLACTNYYSLNITSNYRTYKKIDREHVLLYGTVNDINLVCSLVCLGDMGASAIATY